MADLNKTEKTTRDKIIDMLKGEKGYVSGQEMCDRLSLSRTAVWKHIKALKADGYVIDSVNNRGYRLVSLPDIIDEAAIRSHLHTKWLAGDIVYLPETDSSNIQAKQLGEKGGNNGTVVVTDKQTAGRGRRGRTWISPAGNIYYSILLYPDVAVERASMITLIAAMAVARAVRDEEKLEAMIKWPNDVVVNGKKICGILTESSTDMEYIQYVVVGIGINCNQKEFDDEISDTATSISLELGRDVERAKLLAKFFDYFEDYYDIFLETEDFSRLSEKYNELLINKEREVKIIEKGQQRVLRAVGINDMGGLIVEDSKGNRDTIISGEVSVRGLYGYV
ncbi:MAG: biotin--[Lachnospiraceae bacterium]|nr:biotin--[acetyl-CoA-carboxylase] ligase [Lachnospiraceae bacterium]